jgi:predicted component of type VI protein secretion system
VGDRYARQFRRASGESDLNWQPVAWLSAPQCAEVDQARIQAPAEIRQYGSWDLPYAAADFETHDAGRAGSAVQERDLLATGREPMDCQLTAVNEQDAVAACGAGGGRLGRSSLGRLTR